MALLFFISSIVLICDVIGRWPQLEEWETYGQSSEFGWMQIAEPVMKSYAEATDGSEIERKESALVWHYLDADQGFGFSQAKEMLDHLESVLANEPVAVKSGQCIVEVKPQACDNKGTCFLLFHCFPHSLLQILVLLN